MLRFHARPGSSIAGYLTYSESEYSFSFEASNPSELIERLGDGRRTSLVIDTLQLEAGASNGAVLYAWGYFPAQAWTPAQLDSPPAVQGRVTVEGDPPLEESVSSSVWQGRVFAVEHDHHTGWIRASCTPSAAGEYVEIAHGVVLQIVDGELNSVWLRPHIAE